MKKFLIVFLLLFFVSAGLFALDLPWRHPEIADKNSMFIDIGLPPVFYADPGFSLIPLELRLDYMLPLVLPLSLGIFAHTPNPNFKSFGFRVAYHIDVKVPGFDLYFAHATNLGWVMSGWLDFLNDEAPPFKLFDWRLGFRYIFSSFIGICLESDLRFNAIMFFLTLKIN